MSDDIKQRVATAMYTLNFLIKEVRQTARELIKVRNELLKITKEADHDREGTRNCDQTAK